MTARALERLAVEVMGCAEVRGRAPTEGEYLIYGGGAQVRIHPHKTIFFHLNWNPAADPAQTLALLIATGFSYVWARRRHDIPIDGWYHSCEIFLTDEEVARLPGDDKEVRVTKVATAEETAAARFDLSAKLMCEAATEAVCEVMGIDPEAAE